MSRYLVSTAAVGLMVTLLTGAATAGPRPSVANYAGEMNSVSIVSSADAWAVGGSAFAVNPRVWRWNGSRWAPSAIPHPGANGTLQSVSGLSPSDVWAVGTYFSRGADKGLALHWNGSGWTQVAVPSVGKAPVTDLLNGVSVVSADDAWAVGSYQTSGTQHGGTLILHWNGTSWTRVTSPSPSALANLSAVSAVSPSDIWAVGQYFVKDAGRALLLHWNGTTWTQVTSPNAPGGYLAAVSAVSPTDVWAVGQYFGKKATRALLLHWNGTTWTQVSSPNPGGSATGAFTTLNGVCALSPADAWAVGNYGHDTLRFAVAKTLVLHWNGSTWTQTASPYLGQYSRLNGVAALSPSDAWAVGGRYTRTGPGTTLALRWNGKNWTRS